MKFDYIGKVGFVMKSGKKFLLFSLLMILLSLSGLAFAADGSVEVLTCGRLMVSDRQIITKTEGTNEKGGHAVTVYTSKEGLYIPDYLQVSADGYVMLTDAKGGKAYYYADGYIFAKENRIGYYSAVDKETVESITEISASEQ